MSPKLPPGIVPLPLLMGIPVPPNNYVYVGPGVHGGFAPHLSSVKNYYFYRIGDRVWSDMTDAYTRMSDYDSFYAFHKSCFQEKTSKERLEILEKELAEKRLECDKLKKEIEYDELKRLIEESGLKVGDDMIFNGKIHKIEKLVVINESNFKSSSDNNYKHFRQQQKNFLAVEFNGGNTTPAWTVVKKDFPKIGEKYTGEVVVCGENDKEILFKKNKSEF